jgi:hypothetical protein
MKKKNLKNLSLHKNTVSTFATQQVVGGTGQSVDMTCTGMQTCGNCTVGTSGTLQECDPNNDQGPSRRRCQ